MFIHLIYGNGDRLLMNPNCKILHIIYHLGEKCGMNTKNLIELVPVAPEGVFPTMYKLNPEDYLASRVSERQAYIPAYIIEDTEGEVTSLVPQLRNWRNTFPTLEERIIDSLREDQDERDRRMS